ncbi:MULTISPECIES: single-stranded DNA-binding protein [Nitratiruptor]|uniref:Single-stranded DNA-binding protein n=1 Tax=Nitratiruptor tergarcus DSM 16512 TaxID=1069081 RepID=A0A1W1WSV2_9BACT|nr:MULTISPECIES: single-stranded DNA-binding protein [Nitratiruptor]BCD61944.1 single-strand DNA-binding protein [Nitratiruptor sp. YY08-13]BCD65879.1 single-strand DNA-binding protein [Nitratiruptor sp. YY08-26]SMC09374.1 single-strand binding protein [Nitratiruptor tergarcus DSM 16512]
MYNKVILVGNLTRDIELKYTGTGMAIAKTAIATNRRFKTQAGEQKEEVCFIDITLFGRAAEIANQYLSKGSKVLVEGRLIFEQWTDQSGNKRSKHSVAVDNMQMLGRSEDRSSSTSYEKPASYAQPAQAKEAPAKEPEIPEIDIDEDEIPF